MAGGARRSSCQPMMRITLMGKVPVHWQHSFREGIEMKFKDRRHAGELLAEKLTVYRGKNPLILALPRGGVVVAEPIWDFTGGDLDLIITRKIGAPYQKELAIGAVAGDGFVLLNHKLVEQLGVTPSYIEQAAASEQAEIQRRLALYRGQVPYPSLKGRVVIVVDDGVATGFTVRAALQSLQQHEPAELVLAVPVGPPETLKELQAEVDRLYYLASPAWFAAVGQFYDYFSQISDAQVLKIMKRSFAGLKE